MREHRPITSARRSLLHATGEPVIDDPDEFARNNINNAVALCTPDLDGNGVVGPFDLALVLGFWGPCPEPCTPGDPAETCLTDLDGDCLVGPFDLAFVLGNWGPCE